MLGTFLVDPREVPHVAVGYVAEQIGVPVCPAAMGSSPTFTWGPAGCR